MHFQLNSNQKSIRILSGNLQARQMQRKNADPNNIPVDYKITINPIECTVTPEKFKYPFKNVNGSVTISNRQITIDQLTSSDQQYKMNLSGYINSDSPQKDIELDLQVNNLPLDDKFQQALPVKMNKFYRQLQPLFNISAQKKKIHSQDGEIPIILCRMTVKNEAKI